MLDRTREILLQTLIILLLMFLVALAWIDLAHASPPEIYDSQTGEYLGNLSSNSYDVNSVSNPYGPHGSPYSPTSINNPYGIHGSPYSNQSARNPYATQAPIIIHRGR